jgi:hypothetical protein
MVVVIKAALRAAFSHIDVSFIALINKVKNSYK